MNILTFFFPENTSVAKSISETVPTNTARNDARPKPNNFGYELFLLHGSLVVQWLGKTQLTDLVLYYWYYL